MERARKRIAVVGSGLSGLVTAYEIKKRIDSENLPFELIVLENRSTSGGMIHSIQTKDGVVDVGANSFDVRRGDIQPFLEELGLWDAIEFNQGGKPDHYSNHRFVSNKRATYHGLPLRGIDIALDRELSIAEKLKMMWAFVFRRFYQANRFNWSAKDYIDRRFTDDVATLLAHPNYAENVFGSIELCTPDFIDPQLSRLFDNHLFPISLNERLSLKDGDGQEFRLKDGNTTLVNRLLEEVGGMIEYNRQVTSLYREEEGVLFLRLNDKDEARVGSIVSTVPLTQLIKIDGFRELDMDTVPVIDTSDMGVIHFQYDKGSITNYPKGNGFVIPKRSSFHITKGTLLNRKWPSLKHATVDHLLIEVGRRQEDTIVQLSEEAILTIIEKELAEILEITVPYRSAKLYRFPEAVPHLSLEGREKLLTNSIQYKDRFTNRGLFIGGNGLYGYGMIHAIEEGKRLAAEAIEYMKNKQLN